MQYTFWNWLKDVKSWEFLWKLNFKQYYDLDNKKHSEERFQTLIFMKARNWWNCCRDLENNGIEEIDPDAFREFRRLEDLWVTSFSTGSLNRVWIYWKSFFSLFSRVFFFFFFFSSGISVIMYFRRYRCMDFRGCFTWRRSIIQHCENFHRRSVSRKCERCCSPTRIIVVHSFSTSRRTIHR